MVRAGRRGTLFLDECGELTAAAQVRLLRILQDGTFERVGGEHPLHVDVRIVAATHRDLAAMIGDGRFRQDLWYRLAVFPIRLPPLRDRPADIPVMAAHFALRAAKRLGMPPMVPTAEDVTLLVSYPWPGNVRELAAVIERAAILGGGSRLDVTRALGHRPAAAPTPPIRRAGSRPPAGGNGAVRPPRRRHGPAHRGGPGPMRRSDRRARRRCRPAEDQSPHAPRRMRKLGVDWRDYRSKARSQWA